MEENGEEVLEFRLNNNKKFGTSSTELNSLEAIK